MRVLYKEAMWVFDKVADMYIVMLIFKTFKRYLDLLL